MKRALILPALAVAVLVGYVAYRSVQRSIESAPAREAVLAMTSDQAAEPATPDQRATLPEVPPNIVLIVADDLGWRDVGYNHSEIRTPTIDRLAASGVRLNRFYAHPTCSPTRAALLTGRAPLRLGILNPLSKNNPTGLPLSELTLADRLREAGYATALVGKWHLGPRNLAYHPNARGFDHFYGNLTGGVGYYDKVHGGGYDWQCNGETVRVDGYTTQLLADEAARVIRERDPDQPLFLYTAFGAPHLPNEAPAETVAGYSEIRSEKRRVHAAMVSELDAAIGQIEQALISEGIERQTLLWFLSDNGGLVPKNPLRLLPEPLFTLAFEQAFDIEATPTFSDFARVNLRSGGSDNRPFKGGKQTVSEGGVRVPAFVSWPGTLEATQYNHMATVQDVTPTLLEIAGITGSTAVTFDGRRLWTALEAGRPAPPLEFLVQEPTVTDTSAIYRYPYKLILTGGTGKELYDLEADPLEARNIIQEQPDLVADLTAYFAAFPRGKDVALPLQDVVDDPDYFGGEEDRPPWAEQAYRDPIARDQETPVNPRRSPGLSRSVAAAGASLRAAKGDYRVRSQMD